MTQMITLFYSCAECGLIKIACDVPVRGTESVKTWMEMATGFLSRDHAKRSPHCHPKRLTDIMIPVTGAEKIGGPSIN